MAHEHSNAGQISSHLDLRCLLVKNDGTLVGRSFVVNESENRFISQLAEHIKDRRSDIPDGVQPDLITLWRPDPPLSSLPSGLLSAVSALRFNQLEGEHGVTELSGTAQVRDVFTANQLQKDQIHVIAQLPLDGKGKGSD